MEQKVANGEEIDDPLCKYSFIIFMDFSPITTVNIPGYIYNLKQATGLVFYLLVMKPFWQINFVMKRELKLNEKL